jgi:hypothetical protein
MASAIGRLGAWAQSTRARPSQLFRTASFTSLQALTTSLPSA